jgi:hypothetical protein
VSKIDEDRFDIVDENGGHIKNGLRRAEVITQDEGDALVAMFSHISDLPGDSLWTHLARLRGQLIATDAAAFATAIEAFDALQALATEAGTEGES